MLHALFARLRTPPRRTVPHRPRLVVEALENRTLLHGGVDHGDLEPGVFTDLQLPLAGVTAADIAWGDYDSDGHLDFVVIGTTGTQRLSRIFHNNGNSTFTDIHANLDNVATGASAWGDYDNDGRLDLLLTGFNGTSPVTRLYHNDGGGVFRDVNAPLVGVFNGSADWGDYDQDGRLDILLTGADATFNAVTHVYRNLGQGFFVRQGSFDGVFASTGVWGDLNGDGRFDFLVSGSSPTLGFISRIYQNNGDGTFTDIHAPLPAGFNAETDLGDFDNDGRLDILLSGRTSAEDGFTVVLRNLGNGNFGAVDADLEELSLGTLKWGDFDNDGRLDILMVGTTHDETVARIYHNEDGFQPHFIAGNEEQPVGVAGAAWGDFNNDGNLDIALAGSTSSGAVLRVYRNDGSTINTAPSFPTGLRVTHLSQSEVKLAWNPASDGQTPSAGLTYNLYVGTSPASGDIVGPMANIATGQGRVAQIGALQVTSWTITGLQPGNTYYWSVQAIDASFAGSAFAATATFTTGAAGAAQIKFVHQPSSVQRQVRPVIVQLLDANGQPFAQPGVEVKITVSVGAAVRTFTVPTNAAGQARTPPWLTRFRPGLQRLVHAKASALVDGILLTTQS